MFEIVETVGSKATIKVVGIGGGGGNAVEHMVKADLDGVDFINANTDAQALSGSKAPTLLQIGEGLTNGLGAGANPEIGRKAALEDSDRIKSAIEGADLVFIAAGMGGGTGTGAAPVVAELAREMNMLSVAVVTRPFPFEGQKRIEQAQRGIDDLHDKVDSLIIIPNEKVLAVMGQEATLKNAFHQADAVLFNAVQGIAELITRPGLINVDFADVRTVMSEMGMAVMGSAVASGENRALEAVRKAVSSPLLEDIDLSGAKGILVNIAAGEDMAIGEYQTVGNAIAEYHAPDANVVIGTVLDAEMKADLRVTLVATGLTDSRAANAPPAEPRGLDNIRGLELVPPPSPEMPPDDEIDEADLGIAAGAAGASAGAAASVEQIAQRGGNGDGFGKNGGGVRAIAGGKTRRKASPAIKLDMDLLDLPTFLRRQAD